MLSSRLAEVILSAKWTASLTRGGYAGWTLNLPLGICAVFADAPEQPGARDETEQPELLGSGRWRSSSQNRDEDRGPEASVLVVGRQFASASLAPIRSAVSTAA